MLFSSFSEMKHHKIQTITLTIYYIWNMIVIHGLPNSVSVMCRIKILLNIIKFCIGMSIDRSPHSCNWHKKLKFLINYSSNFQTGNFTFRIFGNQKFWTLTFFYCFYFFFYFSPLFQIPQWMSLIKIYCWKGERSWHKCRKLV